MRRPKPDTPTKLFRIVRANLKNKTEFKFQTANVSYWLPLLRDEFSHKATVAFFDDLIVVRPK